MKLYIIIIISIILHFVSNHLYIYACSPLSVKGLILTPFKTQSPECKIIRWIQDITITNINCVVAMIVQFSLDLVQNITRKINF